MFSHFDKGFGSLSLAQVFIDWKILDCGRQLNLIGWFILNGDDSIIKILYDCIIMSSIQT